MKEVWCLFQCFIGSTEALIWINSLHGKLYMQEILIQNIADPNSHVQSMLGVFNRLLPLKIKKYKYYTATHSDMLYLC